MKKMTLVIIVSSIIKTYAINEVVTIPNIINLDRANVSPHFYDNRCSLDSMSTELYRWEQVNLHCLSDISSNKYKDDHPFSSIIKKDFTTQEMKKIATPNYDKYGRKNTARDLIGKEIPYAYCDAFELINNIDFDYLNIIDMRNQMQLFIKIALLQDFKKHDSRISRYLKTNDVREIFSYQIRKAISNNPTFNKKNDQHRENRDEMADCLSTAISYWQRIDKQKKQYNKNSLTPLPQIVFTITSETNRREDEKIVYSCFPIESQDQNEIKKEQEEFANVFTISWKEWLFNKLSNFLQYIDPDL